MALNKPSIRYLVSSPYGDVPVDEGKWDLPLEGDPLKTSYKKYFHSITDFLSQQEFKPLLDAASKKRKRGIQLKEVERVVIRSEKHGSLYHPASVELLLKEGRVKFGLNVAVSDDGKNWLREELSVLKQLHTKFNLPYLPATYLFGELNSMLFLLEDWFEGYHEFHISRDEKGKERLKLWDFGNVGSGYRYLSSKQSFEIYKQASKILTLYYDFKDFSQIHPWHHAAGDFVVKIDDRAVSHSHPTPPPSRGRELICSTDKYSPSTGGRGLGGGGIDVRLTTARGYKPFTVFDEREHINPFVGLFYFLLDLSVRMHLDKLDGLGELVWADDICIEATVEGFLDALKLRKDFELLGSREDLLILLKSFGQEELTMSFRPIIEHYRVTGDFLLIKANLDKHVERLYATLQNLP